MAVKLEIELDALRDPKVAAALAELLRSLGPAGAALPAPAAVRAPAPSVPAPVAAPVAVADPAPVVTAPPAASPAPKARRKRAKKPVPQLDEAGVIAGWVAFLQRLPARSQRFLYLVRRNTVLTMTTAMSALDITQPKAMGGITGAIGRWGPAQGLPVPYEAIDHDGVRAWRWLGLATVEAALDQANLEGELFEDAPAAEPVVAKPPRVRKAKPAPSRPPVPVRRPVTQAPKAAEAPVADDPEKLHALVSFRAELPSNSQQFLDLIAEQKRLTMPDALKHFGLARSKAIGKVTEPITRLARERDFELPFISERDADLGYRVWRWVGPR